MAPFSRHNNLVVLEHGSLKRLHYSIGHRYKGVIGRSPRFTQNNKSSKGPMIVSSQESQVQDSQKDIYLSKISSTCRLILLVAVDLVASQLFLVILPTARRHSSVQPCSPNIHTSKELSLVLFYLLHKHFSICQYFKFYCYRLCSAIVYTWFMCVQNKIHDNNFSY